MATVKKLLQKILNVNGLVVGNSEVRSESNRIMLEIGVHSRKGIRHQCPICGKRCMKYDTPNRVSSWRGLDFGGVQVWLHARLDRVECP